MDGRWEVWNSLDRSATVAIEVEKTGPRSWASWLVVASAGGAVRHRCASGERTRERAAGEAAAFLNSDAWLAARTVGPRSERLGDSRTPPPQAGRRKLDESAASCLASLPPDLKPVWSILLDMAYECGWRDAIEKISE